MITPDETPLFVKRVSKTATLPKRGSQFAAGFDIASDEEAIIPSKGRSKVRTGISIRCPPGTYGRIAPRSGLANRNGIDVGAGVIDADYTGEIQVILFNFGDEDFKVEKGARIAQLILEKVSMAPMVEVDELPETVRGSDGFGSTGVLSGDLDENGKRKRVVSPNSAPDSSENQ
eukprot:CAMPEP_0118701548 /NCGR_PEP_ID=MMETSP0800-20121206/17321_1 /TAXON_ID=210618 ORGANISM="Striatella unipunctata, Strain CCMP2910" /NCGR_SAMPLE_ID=MMETSP0800 /ASSEMBLY_ACC=CAM_ASM_000638 /LENGTH=173 /DNA_ID=CAMNT_0006602499 /DNA_START=76 /DNA_END=597 /DNA_ORIENTATION=+